MAKNIAQLMVDTLVQAGVERVYGLPGDSLNGFTDSIRKQKKLRTCQKFVIGNGLLAKDENSGRGS
jgi:thiamine pyrophosphate-dependent acetolactate synthase large subunit-like protein